MRAASASWFLLLVRASALFTMPAAMLTLTNTCAAQPLFPNHPAASNVPSLDSPYHRAFACGPADSLDLVEPAPEFTFTHATPQRSETPVMLFERVAAAFGARGIGISPKMIVEDADHANAFIRDEETIVVTAPLIEAISDRSELAFIFAHEMSHIALKHDAAGGVRDEIAADKLALAVVTSLGLNPCAGAEVLDRLSAPLSATLVSISPRLDALHMSTPANCG